MFPMVGIQMHGVMRNAWGESKGLESPGMESFNPTSFATSATAVTKPPTTEDMQEG